MITRCTELDEQAGAIADGCLAGGVRADEIAHQRSYPPVPDTGNVNAGTLVARDDIARLRPALRCVFEVPLLNQHSDEVSDSGIS